jgi:hypothetical protein
VLAEALLHAEGFLLAFSWSQVGYAEGLILRQRIRATHVVRNRPPGAAPFEVGLGGLRGAKSARRPSLAGPALQDSRCPAHGKAHRA